MATWMDTSNLVLNSADTIQYNIVKLDRYCILCTVYMCMCIYIHVCIQMHLYIIIYVCVCICLFVSTYNIRTIYLVIYLSIYLIYIYNMFVEE